MPPAAATPADQEAEAQVSVMMEEAEAALAGAQRVAVTSAVGVGLLEETAVAAAATVA